MSSDASFSWGETSMRTKEAKSPSSSFQSTNNSGHTPLSSKNSSYHEENEECERVVNRCGGLGTAVSLPFLEMGSRFDAMKSAMARRREQALEHKPQQLEHPECPQSITSLSDRRLSRRVRNSRVWIDKHETNHAHTEAVRDHVKEQMLKKKRSKEYVVEELGTTRGIPEPKRKGEKNEEKCVCDGATSGGMNNKAMGYMQLRAAHLINVQRDESFIETEKSLITVLLASVGKEHLCDVKLVGRDQLSVNASKFLLACHSPVFEDIFFPKPKEISPHSPSLTPPENNTSDPSMSSLLQDRRNEITNDGSATETHFHVAPRKIDIGFATQHVLQAAIHFCAAYSLPPDLESECSESNIRTISRLFLFARLFKIPDLLSQSYRAARRMMNKMPHLVCAVFDECGVLAEKAKSDNWWGFSPPEVTKYVPNSSNDLMKYALDYLRGSPSETLLSGGVTILSPSSIEAVVCDQEMDVDEFTMFCILNSWVRGGPGEVKDKMKIGQSLVSHIKLTYIEPLHLNNQVRRCGFVDAEDIEDALEVIAWLLANQSPDEKERVIVEGAGDDDVNGVYVRVDNDIGLSDEEVMYIKEARDEKGCDYGLFLWNTTWAIALCVDYSNIRYSCNAPEVSKSSNSRRKIPRWGWKPVGGREPSPFCTWKPSKDNEKLAAEGKKLAPALEEMKDEGVRYTGTLNGDVACGDHAVRTSLSLSDMMNLPIDEEFENDALQYASLSKDLLTMMDLPVDEGYADEQGGYDVRHMSATHITLNNENPDNLKNSKT